MEVYLTLEPSQVCRSPSPSSSAKWRWLVGLVLFLATVVSAPLEGQARLRDLLSVEHSRVLDGTSPLAGEEPVVTWLGDSGGVSVFQFEGDYSRFVDGSLNLAARTGVAEEFYDAHADAYDFLIVFSTFGYDLGGAAAFHIGVRNDVAGIGLAQFDQSGSFGSAGVLRGYIDMGPLSGLESDPLDPDFESTLSILVHEIFHQWGAYVSFDQGAGVRSDLLQSDGSHWSFLLDSDASVLYGNDWRDNQDGTFTARDALRVLSPLDLYLGGFYEAGETPPFVLLDSPGIDPDRLPEANATIPATPLEVSVAEVIAVEGPRLPSAGQAPHSLRAGFLVLQPPGEDLTAAELVALENIRTGLSSRFIALTGGRGRLEIFPQPLDDGGGGPGGVDGGDIRPTPANVLDALAWLRVAQSSDGFWQDLPSTRVRDSAVVLPILSAIDPLFTPAAAALGQEWLEEAVPLATDLVARRARILDGAAAQAARAELLGRQNADGGWGGDQGLNSNPMDTALALSALLGSGAAGAIAGGRAYLAGSQSPDGGWSMTAGGPSHVASTVASMSALPTGDPALAAAVAWLASRQNPDGGFGDSPSTAHGTALVLQALLDLEATAVLGSGLAEAESYLTSRQDVQGSWEGSVYTTALVARSLQRLALPNWRVVGLSATPSAPIDGETVALSVVVVNDGNAAAPASMLTVFDGDPAAGGLLVESLALPALAAGESATLTAFWDTQDAAGMHELVAVADPDQLVTEVSEADNRTLLAIEVGPAPVEPDLAIGAGAVTITPPMPDRLPTTLSLSTTVSNLGQTDAADVTFALWSGGVVTGELLETTMASVGARSSIVVNFSTDLTEPGSTLFSVVADALDAIEEADEDNNVGSATVTTAPSLDLEILDADVTVSASPIYLGQDAQFTITIRNRGTSDAPVAGLAYQVTDGVEVRDLPAPTLLLGAGEAVERTVLWRVDLVGELTFSAAVDPDGSIPELDESNNLGAVALEALIPDQPNLTVGVGDLTVDPLPALEGGALTLAVVVRNTGPSDIADVPVAFFDGDPAAGGAPIATPVLLPLVPAGGQALAELVWAAVPDASDRIVVVQVDPADAIPELDETDNSTFVEVEVLSLPDLAVATGLIAVDPPQPAPGQTATVTVTVQNLGQQAVTGAVVRVFEGDETTGVEIDLEQFVGLPGEGTADAVFDWTLDAAPTARSLTAVVDPTGEVVESNEDNNAATRGVGVQGGGLAVSAPIFSPNGDGVLDRTTVGFGFETPQTVRVEVVDVERGTLVLRYSGPELTDVTQGEFTWDGIGDQGRRVRDTEYLLWLVAAGDEILGDATVTVDTNLSSLIPALGTEVEQHSNLTCRPNPEDYSLPRREDWGYFAVRSRPTAEYPAGLYRSRLDGVDIERVVSEPWLTGSQSIEQFVVSADGSKLAFERLDEGDPANSNDDVRTLWVANSDGTGLLELISDDPVLPLGEFWDFVGFSASLRTLLVSHEVHGLLEYRLDGPPQPALRAPPGLLYGELSPDHRYLLVSDPGAAAARVLDIDAGVFHDVFPSATAALTFSPDGSRLAVAEGRYLHVVSPQGTIEQTLSLPELLDGQNPLVAADPRGAVWSAKTAELATIVAYDDPTTFCFPQRVLYTVELGTGAVTERARSEPGLPCHFGEGHGSEQRVSDPPGAQGEEATEYAIDQATRIGWDPTDRTLVTSALRALNLDEDDGWRQLALPGANQMLSSTGRYWLYRSSAEAVDPAHPCYNNPGHLIDTFALRSLDNLSAQLTASRPPASDGIELSGTAADKHFRRYALEWSDALDPNVWHPIGLPSTREVFDELLGTWVPPYPGVFTLRLTAEDEAGTVLRRTRRVVSSTSPDLTEVDVQPRLISPNGDGLFDAATVSFDVEHPTAVAIRVLDSAGTVLRTIERAYPSGGVSDNVLWDGRDEAGFIVGDGDYEILVNQYRFPLEVDLTPPELSGSTTLLRPPPGGVGAPGQLYVGFVSNDVNALAFPLSSGVGDPQGDWTPVPAACSSGPAGFQCSAVLDPQAFVGRSLRAVASDLAGNEDALVIAPVQGVVTTAFGAHAVDPATGALSPLLPVGEERFEVLEGPVRFAVTDAVAEDLVDVVAQYRACPCPLPGDPQTPWTDSLLGAVFEPGSSLPVTDFPDPYFEVVWPAEELDNDVEYQVRLRALDESLEEFVSNPIGLLQRPVERLFFGSIARAHSESVPAAVRDALAPAGYDAGRVALVWGRENFVAELSDYRVTLYSDEDPGYAIPRELDFLLAVPDADDESDLYFVMEDWLGCARYQGALTAEGPGGPVASPEATLQLPCLEIEVTYPDEYVAECGAAPLTTERVLSIVPRSLDLAELTLLRITDSLGAEVFRIDAPLSDTAYEWTVETAELSEGRHAFVAELANDAGELHRKPEGVSLVVDRTPPAVAVTFPQPGERVCGEPRAAGPTVTLEGSLIDEAGLDFILEYGRGEAPEQWFPAEVGPINLPPGAPPFEPLGGLEIAPDGAVERAGVFFDYQGPLSRSGSIANESGVLTARLRAVDEGLHLVCEQVTFEFDGLVVGTQLTAAPRSFSPNGDAVLELTAISVTAAAEPVMADVEIYPGVMTAAGPVIQGPLARGLASDLPVNGTEILEWDGNDDGGTRVADGNYLALVGWRDDCGNLLHQALPLEVDTVAPAVEILSPTGGTPLPIVISVFGEVLDANLQGWVLEYGIGGDPLEFVPIASGEVVPAVSPLAEWNTLGLEGEYTLRLRAFDEAGNVGSFATALNFADRLALVTYFEALPDPFSPNGDGRRETTALRFGLMEPAQVTLELSGPTTTLLLDGAALADGAHVEAWDGTGNSGAQVPDGVYLARLTAALAADPLVTQTEETYITLDRVAPVLDLVPEDGDVVTSAGSVFGSITDDNLSAYSIVLDGVEVAAGASAQTDHPFAPLQGLAEGEHSLFVTAADGAENESSTTRGFTIDDTDPGIELHAPLPNARLGAADGPHEVLGSVFDATLDHWLLEVGLGEAPEDWVPLATSSEAIDGLLLSWEVASLPDGPHILRLSALDRAGNESVLALPVVIDNTAPEVSLIAPAAGGWVTQPLEFQGTASDLYLESYELELAPRGSTAFTTLVVGSVSVVEGALGAWSTLPPDGDYDLRLRAADESGNEAATLVEIAVDTMPPAAPEGVVAELVGARDAEVVWTPSVEPDLAGYHVYRDGIRVSTSLLAGPPFLDADLAEGTYAYQTSAQDLAGLESERSVPAAVTVDLTPPAIWLLAPEAAERVGGVVPIEGTAHSPDDFAEYRVLALAPGGAVELLASGDSPVEADLLAAWNTQGLGEDEEYLLRLEADDVNGNTGTFEVTVTIDNLAPAAPAGLVASASADDVNLVWDANSETDLLGYLLFRDDVLVNGNGAVTDYRPYALQETTYDDLDLPDGTFAYVVYAIDEAGNLSPPSAPDSVTLDNRPPAVEIYQPSDGAEFEEALTVRADCPDEDVASVRFQYRATGAPQWSDLGELIVTRPFDTVLDPAAETPPLAFGDYELRAVGTDESGNVDPAPLAIGVVYGDFTAPPAPTGLVAIVTADDVSLTWDAAVDPDLEGYNVYRATDGGVEQRLNPTIVTNSAFDDPDLAEGLHVYRVTAVDASANESEGSDPVSATVYTPLLDQPWTPTEAATIEVAGRAVGGATVGGEVINGSSQPLTPAVADPAGDFLLPSVPLASGGNQVVVRATDAAGNVSKDATVAVVHGVAPGPPTGLAAAVTGFDVDLTWDASPEPQVEGYRAYRDGLPAEPEREIAGLAAAASAEEASAPNAVDGDPATSWSLGPNSGLHWFEVTFPSRRQLAAVTISWNLFATSYAIEVWTGTQWLTAFVGDDDETSVFTLPQPYRTDRLRVRLDTEISYSVSIYEIAPSEQPTVNLPAYSETVIDGTYDYQVTAIDTLGFESGPSTVVSVEVGDVTPPEPVTLTATVADGWDVQLDWTESAAADLAGYAVYRDAALVASLPDRTYLDPALPNGVYQYTVRAFDAAGNESADSNVEQVTVDIAPPAAPSELTAAASGTAIDLSWNPPPGAPPADYLLLRALAAGGPYSPVTTTLETLARDTAVDLEVEYFYVVLARDLAGNESAPSNEASALVPLAVPRLHYPGFPGRETVVESAQVEVRGTGSAGAEITLYEGLEPVGTTTSHAADQGESADVDEVQPVAARLSPNGRYLFVRDPFSAAIYDFDSGDTAPLADVPESVDWVHDSSGLLYLAGPGTVRRYDTSSGVTTELLVLGSASALAAATFEDRWLVVGEHAGNVGVHHFEGGVTTYLAALPPGEVEADSLAWSPDERFLAYVRSGATPGLEIMDLTTGATTILAGPLAHSPSWSRDGSQLAFAADDGAGATQIWLHDVAAGTTEVLTTGGGDVPSWSADGSAIAMRAAGDLALLTLESGESRVLTPCEPGCRPQWVRSGHLLQFLESGNPVRWILAGQFAIDGVALEVGSNDFSATQTLAATTSTSSPVMALTREGELPDLELIEGGLGVLPAVPEVGATVEFSATVANLGAVASPPTDLVMIVTGPEDFYQQLGTLSLPAIAPDGSRTVALEVLADWPAGVHALLAQADPFAAVAEADEENNEAGRAFAVVDTAGDVALSVATDGSVYGADEDLLASAVVIASAAAEVVAILELEDAAGILVERLATTQVVLEAGVPFPLEAVWNTGGTLAGAYRAVARVETLQGSDLAVASADFAIAPSWQLELSVSSQLPTYPPGAPVAIAGAVTYSEGNAVLSDVTATLELSGPAGGVIESWSFALGDLLPGAELSLPLAWDSAGAQEGAYDLYFVLRQGAEVLGEAGASFVLGAVGGTGGSIALLPSPVPFPEDVLAQYSIDHGGSEPLVDLPVWLRIVRPETGELLVERSLVITVPAGGSVAGSESFATSALGMGDYLALLVAELAQGGGTPGEVALDSALLTVADLTPPEVTVLTPEAGGFLGVPAVALIEALDLHSAMAQVEVSLDGGSWQPAAPHDPAAGLHRFDLGGLAEGPHSLRARAADAAGNSATTEPIDFTLDLTPPEIVVTGVEEGGVYGAPVSPVVEVIEANPASETIRLNGEPFASGTAVGDPGTYLLTVEAVDAAGNLAQASLSFTLLPPSGGLHLVVNSANDADDGRCDAAHCSLREAILAANQDPDTSLITFDIPGVAPALIRPATALPALATPVVLDGSSQPGGSCEPRNLAVEVRGDRLLEGGDGLILAADGSAIRGLALTAFPGSGLALHGSAISVSCMHLGVDRQGEAEGNGAHGVWVAAGSSAGALGALAVEVPATGACEGDCNWIAFNGGAGIAFAAGAGPGTSIVGNRIERNDGLAIDLADDGYTANDPLDGDGGPNELQNHPEVVSIQPGAPSTVNLILESAPARDYVLEIYSNLVANGDTEGNAQEPPAGELETLIGRVWVTTDQAGLAQASLVVPQDLTDRFVAATATEFASGSTSEASLASNETALPQLAASKVDVLAIDADGNGVASPGDTLRYTIDIANDGEGGASAVHFDDLIPQHTVVVAGSVTTSQGSVESEDPVAVDLATLAAGASASVAFDVVVIDPVPSGVTSLVNQGTVSALEIEAPLLTDDPDLPASADPTTTELAAAPLLAPVAFLVGDPPPGDGDGQAQPGEVLTYEVSVVNTGNAGAQDLRITDLLPPVLALDPASIEVTLGGGATGMSNGTAGNTLDLVVSTVPGRGGSVVVAYQALVADTVPAGLETLSRAAQVEAASVGPFDTETAAIALDARPVLELTKSDGGVVAEPEETVVYELVLSNTGLQDASNVALEETVPIGSFFDATMSDPGWSCPHGAPEGTTCLLTAGTLTAGLSRSYDFAVAVVPPPVLPEFLINVVSAADDGAGTGGVPVEVEASETTPVDNLVPPTILNLDTVPGSGGGTLEECEETTVLVSGFEVQFSEAMEPATVASLANWLLVGAGPDRDLATTSCAGVAGDDQVIEIASVAYDSAHASALVELSSRLPDSPYRLLACAEGGLTDVTGGELDGNGDGVGGDDFRRTFRVARENEFANGSMDCDLAAWVLVVDGGSTIEHDERADADDASISGAARFINLAGNVQLAMGQCVDAGPGSIHHFGGSARLGPGSPPVELLRACEFFDGPDCSGSALPVQAFFETLTSPGTWVGFENEVASPQAAASALCQATLRNFAAAPFEAHLDSLYLRALVPTLIFQDGFESGDTSAWSATVP